VRDESLVTVLTLGVHRQGQHRQYWDYVCADVNTQQNDFHFLLQSLHHFLTNMDLHPIFRVTFISDGCGKQFACKEFEWVRMLVASCMLNAVTDIRLVRAAAVRVAGQVPSLDAAHPQVLVSRHVHL
jgi:hypothetical protein